MTLGELYDLVNQVKEEAESKGLDPYQCKLTHGVLNSQGDFDMELFIGEDPGDLYFIAREL